MQDTPYIEPDKIRSVCLMLGPYRNLTTLTASVLALHPNCQVLNHGGIRVFGNDELDFLRNYSEQRFDNFVRYALRASAGGRRGKYGGSITLSHAFDPEYKLRELYTKSFGNRLLKEDAHCLFWKESLRTANHIRTQQVDLAGILARNTRLRFLLPVRNPLDCAASNLKTGHAELFQNRHPAGMIEQVLVSIFDEYLWFLKLSATFPDRFFCFFEHTFDENVLREMSRFLSIEAKQQWLRDSMEIFATKSAYRHPQHLVQFYTQCVRNKFRKHPEFTENLLAFQ